MGRWSEVLANLSLGSWPAHQEGAQQADGRNVLLTGLPRSGTTLVCHLLNKLENSVALHEPMTPGRLTEKSSAQIISAVGDFCDQQRRQILSEGTARSKSSNGQVPSNPLSDEKTNGKRLKVVNGRTINVQNVLGPGFTLYLKHPAFFTACLPFLAESMECYASVRNPLSVLLSWRNADMPVSRGTVPNAERFDIDLTTALSKTDSVLDRQLLLIDYFFGRYARYLPGRCVKYEDVAASGGRALTLITPDAAALEEPLQSRNQRSLKDDPEARSIAEKLLKRDSPCWEFYSRSDVEALFQ